MENVDGKSMDKPWRNLGIHTLAPQDLVQATKWGHDRRKAESGSCLKLQLDNNHCDHVLF